MKRPKYRSYSSGIALILLSIGFQFFFLTGGTPWVIFTASLASRVAGPAVVPMGETVGPTEAVGVTTPTPTPTHTVDIAANKAKQSYFQKGMIFPQWGRTAYSILDTNWNIGLKEIQSQTGAQWIGLTINLYQASWSSTEVVASEFAPTPYAVASGIRLAHAMHYHVMVIPLLTVGGTLPWAGTIHFSTNEQTQAWFDSYWQTLSSYVLAASQAGAEEFSLGTEYELLQLAPPFMWSQLIERVHSIFAGKIVYGMNWSSVHDPIPAWMYNPLLFSIGVSGYFPLVDVPERVDPRVMPALWREKAGSYLDDLALRLGKPVFISEIGYRDSTDALYTPWEPKTGAPTDPEEQAGAYNAALADASVDPDIIGIFIWAWSVPGFEPNWRPAAQALHRWYTSITR